MSVKVSHVAGRVGIKVQLGLRVVIRVRVAVGVRGTVGQDDVGKEAGNGSYSLELKLRTVK